MTMMWLFPRGLMIDTARHFQPLASIRTIIDSLPYAKLNVLHWHIVDSQSFPFIRSQPKAMGRCLRRATHHADVASIVEYARLRGIRVRAPQPLLLPRAPSRSGCRIQCAQLSSPSRRPMPLTSRVSRALVRSCPSSTCLGTPSRGVSATRSSARRPHAPRHSTCHATRRLPSWNDCRRVLGRTASRQDAPPGSSPMAFYIWAVTKSAPCWESTPRIAAWLRAHQMSADGSYALCRRTAAMAMAQGRRPVQWSEVYDHFGRQLPKRIVHVEGQYEREPWSPTAATCYAM